MQQKRWTKRSLTCIAAAIILLPWPAPRASAQLPSIPSPDWLNRDSWMAGDLSALSASPSSTPDSRSKAIHLFRIPTYLGDPVGLDLDDPSTPAVQPSTTDQGPDWIQFSMGNDNPNFDMHRRGDPGGVGYLRVASQVQLFDSGKTGCSFGFQAVTPAGPEQVGNFDGPSVVIPSLTVFHALDDGTGFQGFFGRNLRIDSFSNSRLAQGVEYGVSYHRPLTTDDYQAFKNVYVFVEALGRYRYESAIGVVGPSTPSVFEVVPGLHFKMSENLWLSGGIVLPMSSQSTTSDSRLWQLTCSFQF